MTRGDGHAAPRTPRVPWGWLAALAAAIALHGVVAGGLLGGVGSTQGPEAEPPTAAVATRTIAAAPPPPPPEPEPVRAAEAPAAPAAAVVLPPTLSPVAPRVERRRVAASAPAPAPSASAALPPLAATDVLPAVAATSSGATVAGVEAGEAVSTGSASAPVAADPTRTAAAAAPEALRPGAASASATADGAEPPPSGLPPILAAGEAPPPVYRVALPPPALWRYEVRRGFFRGTGEIRWQPAADGATYRLALEARVGGLVLMRQTSEGVLDARGVAPERFVDQRARRAAIAATFDRAAGAVTFSAVTRSLPLYPGTQDRLSWLVQLAAIARAEPGRLAAGDRVEMVVVGARGDASVWSFRSEGVEAVDTVAGPVRAVKLVRAPRGAWDSGAQVWLDPERGHAPVHATLKNAQGQVEYDLLLERIDALP